MMTQKFSERLGRKVQKSKLFEFFQIFYGFRKFSSNNLAIFLPKRFSNNRLELPRFHFRVENFDHFLTILIFDKLISPETLHHTRLR